MAKNSGGTIRLRTSELILSLISANDGLEGKTTIQKLVYFAEQLRIPLRNPPVFRAHFYGPYSAEVDFQLDKLAGLGFLHTATRNTINDHQMYTFSPTDSGREILRSIKLEHPEELEKVISLVRTIKNSSGLNPYTLSYAAKVHHIATRAGHPVTNEEVRSRARDIGWKMNDADIEKGVRLLAELGLIKR